MINGGTYMSKYDLAEVFPHLKNYLLLTRDLDFFNAPSVKSAPAIFQHIMDTILDGMEERRLTWLSLVGQNKS